MSKFNYTAKNANGDLIRDVIESDHRQSALTELRRKGLTVVTLMEIESDLPEQKKSHPTILRKNVCRQNRRKQKK